MGIVFKTVDALKCFHDTSLIVINRGGFKVRVEHLCKRAKTALIIVFLRR